MPAAPTVVMLLAVQSLVGAPRQPSWCLSESDGHGTRPQGVKKAPPVHGRCWIWHKGISVECVCIEVEDKDRAYTLAGTTRKESFLTRSVTKPVVLVHLWSV